MSSFRGFLDNLFNGITNPKGNLGDFAHAQAVFRNGYFRLAPRQKFLYHTVFELSDDALKVLSSFNSNTMYQKEINLLVKTADLPKMNMTVATKNQYNRKKNLQTAIEYDPVTITFHDDNLGLTTALLEGYYRYYFADGNHQQGTTAFGPRNTYKGEQFHGYRYGFDNDSIGPFFKSIQIYQLTRKSYTGFELINPLITSIQHDTMDYSDNSGTVENQIQIAYEGVRYSRGGVEEGTPKGFGEEHYDKSPSPLTTAGGGTGNVFGAGGILEGIGEIFDGFQDGLDLGDVVKIVNVGKQIGDLSKDSLRNEGLSVAKALAVPVAIGVANTVFPKRTEASIVEEDNKAFGGIVDTGSTEYAGVATRAAINNEITDFNTGTQLSSVVGPRFANTGAVIEEGVSVDQIVNNTNTEITNFQTSNTNRTVIQSRTAERELGDTISTANRQIGTLITGGGT